MRNRPAFLTLAAIGVLGLAGARAEANELVLYCSPQIEWCNLMVEAFETETGIRVAMTRKSSGETFAQIAAEARNPRGDVWWGGTGDPHLQAAEEDLTEEYRSPMLDQLHDWARRQAEQSNYRTVGIYAGALGFGYNSDVLAQKGLPAPACWKDLADPVYRDEIEIANPNSSGTAYTALATFVQLFGEDEAFDFLRELHQNISQYTRSGAAPITDAARGETTIGIVFLHDAVTQVVEQFPIVPVAPCEGTGYEIGSMSIIKGARNMDSAKRFYDWALSAEVQELARNAKAYQVPSNAGAVAPPEAPDFATIQLIDYDFALYGSSDERTRLLSKWDEEVFAQPR